MFYFKMQFVKHSTKHFKHKYVKVENSLSGDILFQVFTM